MLLILCILYTVYCILTIKLEKSVKKILRKIHLQYLLDKNLHVSELAQSKPGLFKGQLYLWS